MIRSIIFSLIVLSTSTCLMSACKIFTKADTEQDHSEVQLSDRLSNVKLTSLDGREYRLQELAGKPIFLNFWATWCAPCVSEMPSIEHLYQKYGDEIVFLAASTENLEKITRFKSQRPFHFEYAKLDVTYLDVYVVELPTTLLINRRGEIVYEEEGGQNWSSNENEAKVKAILR